MSNEWVMVPREPTANQLVDGAYEVPDPISHRGELTARMVYRAMLDAAPQQADPVAWRDHVEQRLHTWRQRFVNRSGDQLALDDFMGKESIDDLIDYVCDEYVEPRPAAEVQRLRVAARAVIDRWDSPKWKDEAPTADVINELRRALEGK